MLDFEFKEPDTVQNISAVRYQRQAGKLSTVTLGMDDLVVIVHRYLGDNFGVHVANLGVLGPIPGETIDRAIGLFNHSQVGAFADHYALAIGEGEELGSPTDEYVRTQIAPLEWQNDWPRMRQRLLLARPGTILAATGSWAVRHWLHNELVSYPAPRDDSA